MEARELLRRDLAAARKNDDMATVSLIRTLIAAIENAEAVDPIEAGGETEMPRRRLSEADILNIILAESDELRRAADDYERRGNGEEARRLRSLSEVADRYAQTFDE